MKTKILLLGGFLGSGKTTVLTQLVKYLAEQTGGAAGKIAVIENEIGDVSIDRVVLDRRMVVRDIFAGCICCTMSTDLVTGIRDIQRQYHSEWIIIEATGLAYPEKIEESVRNYIKDISMKTLLLADAYRLKELIELLPLVSNQLRAAETVLLNKIDLVTLSELDELHRIITEINPDVKICDISAKETIDSQQWEGWLSGLNG